MNMAFLTVSHIIRFDIYLAAWAAMMWTKFILMFQNTKLFGPTIQIIIVMTINLIKFILVWSLVILTFGCVGLLMFNHVQTFSTTTGAFYFLICAALGNWDSTIFD